MQYQYRVLEEVLASVAKDYSDDNIRSQLRRLTSDELRKLKQLLVTIRDVEDARSDNSFEDVA